MTETHMAKTQDDTSAALDAADKQNTKNLKALKDGGTLPFIAARHLVLIGDGHKSDVVKLARQNGADRYAGTITIEKGGFTGPGKLTATGLKANRAEFEQAIGRISKKKVVWT